MRVCVVGSGAREHALALACARTAEVVVTPGNPGMVAGGTVACPNAVSISEAPPEECAADLFVVGPEAPLVEGLADRLRSRSAPVLGPGADGARLEGSKAFMKDLVARAGVPTARHATVERPEEAREFFARLPGGPFVVKTDGLAGGKGVLVTSSLEEALEDVAAKLSGRAFGTAGRRVVVEEGLSGPELSLLVLCDGHRALPLPAAQDSKRVADGDRGPNTGGMGAYSPVPLATSALIGRVMEEIVEPSLAELRRRGVDYRGVLYAGLMCPPEGPRLVEYNVRFGDPEAEVVLPRVEGDLTALLLAAATGRLPPEAPPVSRDAAVCVVLAAAGYPGTVRTGDLLRGVEEAGTVEGVTVLHGATALDDRGQLVSAGGRVLTLTATGPTLAEARRRAYAAVERVELPGGHYRRDIAAAAAEDAAAGTAEQGAGGAGTAR